jgi:hypothetical protein
MENQASLNFGINLVSDNVYKTDVTTTNSTNYFAQAVYQPLAYPVYVNMGINNSITENDSEENKMKNNSNSFNIGTGYTVETIPVAPTKFSINFNNTNNKDAENQTFEIGKNNITLSAKSKFDELPLNTTLSFSTSMNSDDVADSKYTYNSIYLKGEMMFKQDKIRSYLDMRFSSFGGDIDSQSSQLFNLGGSYNIKQDTYVSSDLGFKIYSNSVNTDADYSNFNFRMKITQKF